MDPYHHIQRNPTESCWAPLRCSTKAGTSDGSQVVSLLVGYVLGIAALHDEDPARTRGEGSCLGEGVEETSGRTAGFAAGGAGRRAAVASIGIGWLRASARVPQTAYKSAWSEACTVSSRPMEGSTREARRSAAGRSMGKLACRIAYLALAGTAALSMGCLSDSIDRPPPSAAMSMPDKPVWSEEPLPAVATDHFDELAAIYLAPPPRPIRRSISLGFIGDEPLGRYDRPRAPLSVQPSSELLPDRRTPGACRCARVCAGGGL